MRITPEQARVVRNTIDRLDTIDKEIEKIENMKTFGNVANFLSVTRLVNSEEVERRIVESARKIGLDVLAEEREKFLACMRDAGCEYVETDEHAKTFGEFTVDLSVAELRDMLTRSSYEHVGDQAFVIYENDRYVLKRGDLAGPQIDGQLEHPDRSDVFSSTDEAIRSSAECYLRQARYGARIGTWRGVRTLVLVADDDRAFRPGLSIRKRADLFGRRIYDLAKMDPESATFVSEFESITNDLVAAFEQVSREARGFVENYADVKDDKFDA